VTDIEIPLDMVQVEVAGVLGLQEDTPMHTLLAATAEWAQLQTLLVFEQCTPAVVGVEMILAIV
jgi:hypothetical protein